MNGRRTKFGWFFYFIIGVAIVVLFMYVLKGFTTLKVAGITFSQFLQWGEQNKFKKIVQTGDEIEAELKQPETIGGRSYTKVKTTVPEGYLKDAKGYDKVRKFVPPGEYEYHKPSTILPTILGFLPWVLLILLIWFFFVRQMRMANPNNILSFGRVRTATPPKDRQKVTFDDVAGVDEAKEDLREVVEFLKNPEKFRKLGARLPKGILLVGPTGTGKTLLARAIAGEANVPFFSVCGSDFVEMFVGVGAARVRDLFRKAKENNPCIVFLDEIDAVGRRRGSGLGGGHDEREQTLNAILVEMDGFEAASGLIVLAATNRPDILDPALLRPGRFDREVVVDLPDVKGREAILKVHARKVKMAKDVDLSVIAKTTPYFSGADLENIVNEAAIIAATKGKDCIDLADLEEARDKTKWGKQKKSKIMDEEDKKITAYHESGHALVVEMVKECDPIHKITIIPRGVSLGSTMTMPEKDRYHLKKSYCLAIITMLYGGRAAEELFFDDLSAGARDDIKRATELARSMVCEWGMSEKLGPICYTEAEEHLFLGREITRTARHSDDIALEIDKEIHKIIDSCYKRAKKIVTENKDKLERLAQTLLKHETLSAEEVKKVLQGIEITASPNK